MAKGKAIHDFIRDMVLFWLRTKGFQWKKKKAILGLRLTSFAWWDKKMLHKFLPPGRERFVNPNICCANDA